MADEFEVSTQNPSFRAVFHISNTIDKSAGNPPGEYYT